MYPPRPAPPPPAKWPLSPSVSPSLSPSVVSEIVVQVDRFQISVMQRDSLTRGLGSRWAIVAYLSSSKPHSLFGQYINAIKLVPSPLPFFFDMPSH